MKKILSLSLSLAVLFSGCAARQKNITDLPAGVTQAQVQKWDTAVANLHKIATSVSAARQLVIDLNKQGVFPDGDAYVATITGIGKIDQVELSSANFLDAVPNTWGSSTSATIQNNMNEITAALQKLNTQGVTGIKNPDSLKQVNTFLSEISGFAAVILSLTN
jgi:PBP1b-binding outer membrane lipoprotein LpoB